MNSSNRNFFSFFHRLVQEISLLDYQIEELISPTPNEMDENHLGDNVGSGFVQDKPDLSIQDELSNETNVIPEDVNLDDQCSAPRCVLTSFCPVETF